MTNLIDNGGRGVNLRDWRLHDRLPLEVRRAHWFAPTMLGDRRAWDNWNSGMPAEAVAAIERDVARAQAKRQLLTLYPPGHPSLAEYRS